MCETAPMYAKAVLTHGLCIHRGSLTHTPRYLLPATCRQPLVARHVSPATCRPAICRQPLVASHWSPAAGRQPRVASRWSPAVGRQPLVASRWSPAIRSQPFAASHSQPSTGHQPHAVRHSHPATDRQPLAASHWSPGTGSQPLAASRTEKTANLKKIAGHTAPSIGHHATHTDRYQNSKKQDCHKFQHFGKIAVSTFLFGSNSLAISYNLQTIGTQPSQNMKNREKFLFFSVFHRCGVCVRLPLCMQRPC